MLRPRITPCLLLRDGGLVKTVKFGDAKYVGDPINAVRIFNEKEADELIVLDIDATVLGREPDVALIAQLAAECRMPLCYGGGIRTAAQARAIIGLGVEKVAISAAAVERPGLLADVAAAVGRQSVVAVFDVLRTPDGGAEVVTHHAQRRPGVALLDAVREAERQGAGEILVNAVDRDGVMRGYDLDLAGQVRAATRLPMSVLGGAGSLADMAALFRSCGVVGAAAGSIFVFKGPYRAVLINYPGRVQKDDLIRSALPD